MSSKDDFFSILSFVIVQVVPIVQAAGFGFASMSVNVYADTHIYIYVLYYTMLCYIISYYIILNYIILYYIILNYTI